DHPDRADHLSRDHASRLRPDLVRRHHRDDGGAWPDPSAGRHERLCHQERCQGRLVLDDLPRRDPVRGDRPGPAGDPDRVPAAGDLAADPDGGRDALMTPTLQTKYVFTITAHI